MMELQQWTAALTESLSRAAIQVLEYLPTLLGATVLLLLGWGVARLFRYATVQIVERTVKRLAHTRPMDTRVQSPSTYSAAPQIASRIVFWVVLLFFFLAATELLNLQLVSSLLSGVTGYLPQLLAGLLIIFIGLWLAEFARAVLARAAGKRGIQQGEMLGRLGYTLVMLVVFSIAAGQVGIDDTLLVALLVALFAVTLAALAFAFAIGARTTISNLLGRHSIEQTYGVGDVIRIGNHEGTIIELTRTGVILESAQGTILVPGKRFSEEASLRLSKHNPA